MGESRMRVQMNRSTPVHLHITSTFMQTFWCPDAAVASNGGIPVTQFKD